MLFVNLNAGMTAGKPAYLNFEAYRTILHINCTICHPARSILIFNRNIALSPHTTSTAYIQYSLTFRINIDKSLCCKVRSVEVSCAKHSNLLIARKHCLYRRMRNRIRSKHCQYKCNCNSIISAKSCAVSPYHLTISASLNALYTHVNIAIRLFLTHHIKMSLQNHRLTVLISRRTSLKYNNIISGVLPSLKPMQLSKLQTIIRNHPGIPRTMWNGAYFFKIRKHLTR